SASSAETLTAEPKERAKLKAFLDERDMYLYTVNAFPYGPFKNTVVMENVYEPDWRSDERASYTKQVADILAEVCVPGIEPTIQSPPLGFKPRVTGPDVVAAYTRQVIGTVAHLVKIRERTDRIVRLALEPEPACFLETTEEAVDYFTNHLYADDAVKSLAEQTGISRNDAVTALRTLADRGIPVFKLQEAAAVRVPEVTQEKVDALRPYTDTVYLTQTVERRDGELRHFLNLTDAFEAWERDPGGQREWRTHFHVPVFLDDLGDFKTTRFAIEDALKFHKENKLSPHLEIETYTWDVLPEHLKTGDIVDYVTRELEWVRDQLL